MVGRPQSKALETQKNYQILDNLEREALRRYREEHDRELGEGERHKGARKICDEVSDEHFQTTKTRIKLNHTTLLNHFNGGTTMSDFNRTKRWLTAAEEDIVVTYAIEMAAHGFPLSPRRLREHATQILKFRL
ncbi:hypothetical protein EV368DRAFT_25060, partial [Lentinula lateritia]